MASLDILILALLSRHPAHGYELKKRVEAALGGAMGLNNKVLYPTLKRFEAMGAVTSELVTQDALPPRRVFAVTDKGLDALRDMLEDFDGAAARNPAEFQVRFAFFDLLPPGSRMEILQRRLKVVESDLERFNPGFVTNACSRWADSHLGALLELFGKELGCECDWLRAQMDAELDSGWQRRTSAARVGLRSEARGK
jgi:DNA-binding PadR family transcriptional regulator